MPRRRAQGEDAAVSEHVSRHRTRTLPVWSVPRVDPIIAGVDETRNQNYREPILRVKSFSNACLPDDLPAIGHEGCRSSDPIPGRLSSSPAPGRQALDLSGAPVQIAFKSGKHDKYGPAGPPSIPDIPGEQDTQTPLSDGLRIFFHNIPGGRQRFTSDLSGVPCQTAVCSAVCAPHSEVAPAFLPLRPPLSSPPAGRPRNRRTGGIADSECLCNLQRARRKTNPEVRLKASSMPELLEKRGENCSSDSSSSQGKAGGFSVKLSFLIHRGFSSSVWLCQSRPSFPEHPHSPQDSSRGRTEGTQNAPSPLSRAATTPILSDSQIVEAAPFGKPARPVRLEPGSDGDACSLAKPGDFSSSGASMSRTNSLWDGAELHGSSRLACLAPFRMRRLEFGRMLPRRHRGYVVRDNGRAFRHAPLPLFVRRRRASSHYLMSQTVFNRLTARLAGQRGMKVSREAPQGSGKPPAGGFDVARSSRPMPRGFAKVPATSAEDFEPSSNFRESQDDPFRCRNTACSVCETIRDVDPPVFSVADRDAEVPTTPANISQSCDSTESDSQGNSNAVSMTKIVKSSGPPSSAETPPHRRRSRGKGASKDRSAGPKTTIVMKVIHKAKCSCDELDRLSTEAQFLSQISHPHVVRLLSQVESTTEQWLFFEHAPLGDLYSSTVFRTMEEGDAKWIILQIVLALYSLHYHYRIIHGDLKPHNVLLFHKPGLKEHYASHEGAKLFADLGLRWQQWTSADTRLPESPQPHCLSDTENAEDIGEPLTKGMRIATPSESEADDRVASLKPGALLPLFQSSASDGCLISSNAHGRSSGETLDFRNAGSFSLNSEQFRESSVSSACELQGIVPECAAPGSVETPHVSAPRGLQWTEIAIKLGDFGLSQRVTDESTPIPFEGLRGTHGFFAPELLGRQPYNCRVDMWALGVIAFTLVAGYEPFFPASKCTKEAAEFDPRYWSHVSPACKDFIKGLLERNPNERFSSLHALNHIWLRSAFLV